MFSATIFSFYPSLLLLRLFTSILPGNKMRKDSLIWDDALAGPIHHFYCCLSACFLFFCKRNFIPTDACNRRSYKSALILIYHTACILLSGGSGSEGGRIVWWSSVFVCVHARAMEQMVFRPLRNLLMLGWGRSADMVGGAEDCQRWSGAALLPLLHRSILAENLWRFNSFSVSTSSHSCIKKTLFHQLMSTVTTY